MPLAIANQNTEKFDLKTLPGAFIELRRMSYGEKMHRSGLMSGLKVKGSNRSKDFEGELMLANQRVTEYEFAVCIVGHNLEKDDKGTLLDFKNKFDLGMLDGKVGEEIGVLLNKVNLFDEEGEEALGESRTESDLSLS